MKGALFLGVSLLLLPPVAEAQLELGFDTGVSVLRTGGQSLTSIDFPSGLRIGIGLPGEFTFESLFKFSWLGASGQSSSTLEFLPGIAYNIRANTYIRGEVGMLQLTGVVEDRTFRQYAYGIAAGTKRQIGAGPLYLRLETGLDKWVERENQFLEASDFRGTVGITVVLN